MAFTEVNTPSPAFDPAPAAKKFRDSPKAHGALDQLAVLHQEANQNLMLSQLLARSPLACLILMAAGGLAILWANIGDGGTLKSDFAWAGLVLLGVVAMTRNFIRGYARSLRRVPLQEAAADFRVLLLYSGAAWGVGSYLIMPGLPDPALVFCFAVAPSTVLAMALRETKAATAFVLPAGLITVGATFLGQWPFDVLVAIAIIAADIIVIGSTLLHRTKATGTAAIM
jgi:hypothetical protein